MGEKGETYKEIKIMRDNDMMINKNGEIDTSQEGKIGDTERERERGGGGRGGGGGERERERDRQTDRQTDI